MIDDKQLAEWREKADCGEFFDHYEAGALLDEVERLRAEVEAMRAERDRLQARLDAECRCGSGAHPRVCERHTGRYDAHRAELNLDTALDEIAEWKEATGLVDGHGDPDGVEPEDLAKHLAELKCAAEARQCS